MSDKLRYDDKINPPDIVAGALTVVCPTCGAPKQGPCGSSWDSKVIQRADRVPGGYVDHVHVGRIGAWSLRAKRKEPVIVEYDDGSSLTRHQQWSAAWTARCEQWDKENPRPRADHPRRRAWALKRERDSASWQKLNPCPERTAEEKAALEPLLRLHRALVGS